MTGLIESPVKCYIWGSTLPITYCRQIDGGISVTTLWRFPSPPGPIHTWIEDQCTDMYKPISPPSHGIISYREIQHCGHFESSSTTMFTRSERNLHKISVTDQMVWIVTSISWSTIIKIIFNFLTNYIFLPWNELLLIAH